MKIEGVTVVVTKYKLELSEEQLIALGLLSYRHEEVPINGVTFYKMLPMHIKDEVDTAATKVNQNSTNTKLEVHWNG